MAVLANRTINSIRVDIERTGQLPTPLTIASGDSTPIFFQQGLRIQFGSGLRREQYPLRASSAYFFTRGTDGQNLHLEQIGLGEQTADVSTTEPPRPKSANEAVTIEVKLLTDDDQPTHRRIWEPKLRKRIRDASAILERQSGIRLQVVEVATWQSDENQRHFLQTLREFERSVKVKPGQLAIGFSSQYEAQRGRSHLGVTRLPLHSHILLRERSRNLLEVERLELLVHELGHYLGASHSPEPQSVMRPMLTRGPQRAAGSRVIFDPVNALLVAMMGEEIRDYGLTNVRSLSAPTRERFKEIYHVLSSAMPRDPAARQYLRFLEIPKMPQKPVVVARKQRASPLVRDTHAILTDLLALATQHAESRAAAPAESEAMPTDELTNLYVRQAARSAQRLNSQNSRRALLLALGIFVDDATFLRTLPTTASLVTQVESDDERAARLKVLGKPTMRERTDLTKHFFVSAHLHVAVGKVATVAAGLAKEMRDANGGTGFSFIDMAANRAGIVFAERLLDDKLDLAELAESFHVDDFLPTLRGLKEGLTLEQLEADYGGEDQTTVAEELARVEDRVLSLPVYDR
ncbi:MAG: M12 family metallo-peptidase [Planctomycetota bacterium]